MVTTVIGAVAPELMTDTPTVYAASVAFLTNTIGCGGRAVR